MRLVCGVLLVLGLAGPAMAVEPGVSRELARARAARVADVRYELSFALKEHAETTAGHEVLTFVDRGAGDLAVDFRDGAIASATLNGAAIGASLENGHLVLPSAGLMHGPNTLEVSFTANTAAAGKAITRYEDKDDGSEYVYTLFVPMDASMAFPCFDQPDLKGRFTLTVRHPAEWTVLSNTAGAQDQATATSFPETKPISTYLFAFAAGPFARIEPGGAGQPAMYVRKSQLARARVEAPQVQAMTARGIAYLSDYFAQPFPFPKYDLVLIPGFPFGGMEHAGATFLNEDGVLFRTAPTQADYFRRNVLVLHETCHQWFGDLVTMRWFDDLWLKEGFAQYMAYKAMYVLEPKTEPWKHFYEDIKPLAYGIDETQGTTPIFQVIPNLKDAKSAYGAIVYQKAPAVLKQLNFRLGDVNFRDGLRLYLKQHAYGNAQWADLIGAFEATGKQDVKSWADAWILRRGMPQVDVDLKCSDGVMTSLALRQHDVLGSAAVWPISSEVFLLFDQDCQPDAPCVGAGGAARYRVDWNTSTYAVPGFAKRQSCPRFVFANDGDEAYGRFLLDPVSEAEVTRELDRNAVATSAGLLHSQLWGALWDEVRVAKLSPQSYVELAIKTLPTERDESLNRIQGARLSASLHDYMGPQSKAAVLPRAEAVAADKMMHADALGLRIVNFRTFTSVSETPAALGQVKALLDGSLVVPGMPLKLQDRWNLVGHLLAMADPEAEELVAKERARDRSGEAQKYTYAAGAGMPDLRVKARYFDEYLHSTTVQEDWITQSLRPFNSWNQSALTLPYLARALDALPEIKAHRKIFFLGAWLGAFVDGQNSAEAQNVVRQWLARTDVDPDLRLKVLEVSDALDRTVMIRARYPQ